METPKPPSGGIKGVLKACWMYVLMFFCGGFWCTFEFLTPHKQFDAQKAEKRPGDVVLITGGTRGIGKEIIKKLLIMHMHVILGVRNKTAAKVMVEEFRRTNVATGTVDIWHLDLKSLASVREFAGHIVQKYPKIHILINNAGIFAPPYELSEDGIEMTLQVNHLSHFLLTQMLIPSLNAAGTTDKPSRIVHLSSVGHYVGKLDWNDLWLEKAYGANWAYGNSKLMQAIFSRDLNGRMMKAGYAVRSYSVHPGCVFTGLFNSLNKIILGVMWLFFMSSEKGADGVLYVALSPDIQQDAGKYFQYCKPYPTNSQVKNREAQEKLWKASCEATGCNVTLSNNGKSTIPSTEVNLSSIPLPNEVDTSFPSNKRNLQRKPPKLIKPMNKIEVEVKPEILSLNMDTSKKGVLLPTTVGSSD